MNLDELATNVARDIGAVRQISCKRADGVEYRFEQSELEQFAKELIAEYEKTVNSELYPRPDPRVAELEAKLQQMNSLCEFNERTMSDIASKYEALVAKLANENKPVDVERAKSLYHPSFVPFKCPVCGSEYFGPLFAHGVYVGRYCKGRPSGFDRSYTPCRGKHEEMFEQGE